MTDINEEQIFKPLVTIGQKLNDIAKESGMTVVNFAVSPSLVSNRHTLIAYFLPDDSFTQATVVKKENNAEFDELIENQRATEVESSVEAARQRLIDMQKKLNDPSKGLGLDE